MCYDVNVQVNLESISDYFPGIEIQTQLSIDAITGIHVQAQSFRKCPVVLWDEGRYKLVEFEWGVIADYMRTPEDIKKYRSLMCNAQSEKILDDKRSAWHRLRTKRCLIPVLGIYEHREIKGWKNKVPYFISLKNRGMFALPGIYNYSPVPDVETGELKGTFTVVTRAANAVMKQIHNGGSNAGRMPLFLPKQLEQQWLQPGLTDEEMREILNYEMPPDELEHFPVHTIRTTKPRPDNLYKNARYDWPGLPQLGIDEPVQQQGLF